MTAFFSGVKGYVGKKNTSDDAVIQNEIKGMDEQNRQVRTVAFI